MHTAICNSCKVEKSHEEFSWKDKKSAKRNTRCRQCIAEYFAQHYQKNKFTYISRAKKTNLVYRARNQEKLYDFLRDKSCIDCGFSDVRALDFDHKNPNDKKTDVSAMVRSAFSWDTIMEEINKCEIRCANCHRIKTAEQQNTFKHNKIVTEYQPA